MYDFCLTIPYGFLVGFGGLTGVALHGNSTTALVSTGAGTVLTALGFLSLENFKKSPKSAKKNLLYPGSSCVISAGLTVFLSQRYAQTQSIFPIGLTAITSAGMTLFYVAQLLGSSKETCYKDL